MVNQDSPRWMIYGANGYTGEIAARRAVRRGLTPVLAGRRSESVEPLARELGLESVCFSLADHAAAVRGLTGVAAVLNCAGPFSATAQPMLEACLEAKTHYLDITGEIDVFELVHRFDRRLKDAGVAALPGAGFDVVPTDCVAALLKEAVPNATHLRIAFKTSHGKPSPGSMKTMVEALPVGARVRRNGHIVHRPDGTKVERFPFRDGKEEPAVSVSWGDVSTAYYSTGIDNIECFMGLPPEQLKGMQMGPGARRFLGLGPVQKALKTLVDKAVKGPNEAERRGAKAFVVGEASGPGKKARLRMTTPEGYEFTADAGIEATLRAARGEIAAGAQTPSLALGSGFAQEIEGVVLEELPV